MSTDAESGPPAAASWGEALRPYQSITSYHLRPQASRPAAWAAVASALL